MTETRPRYATSRDANQTQIVEELRELGFYVRDVSAHIAEWDIEVYGYSAVIRREIWQHFEIKTKRGRLQRSQAEFRTQWGEFIVAVVDSTEDVLKWYGRVGRCEVHKP